ncbi:unnamed protein product, partial [Ectocarpus sp. 12 AP-2014]
FGLLSTVGRTRWLAVGGLSCRYCRREPRSAHKALDVVFSCRLGMGFASIPRFSPWNALSLGHLLPVHMLPGGILHRTLDNTSSNGYQHGRRLLQIWSLYQSATIRPGGHPVCKGG